MKTIFLVAAGTGGHTFPALALAEELSDRGVKPVFAGRRASMEQELVARYGFEFRPLQSSGFFGKGLAAKGVAALNAVVGFFRVLNMTRALRPDAVVAAGGFGSFTPLLAAVLLKKPYYLLEQNRIPGRVTRYFARGAVETFLTFPLLNTLAAKCVVTGTPLRRTLLRAARHDDGRTVLILGGSGGARALSLAGVELARQSPELHVIVLTGQRDYDLVRAKTAEAGLKNLELVDFTLGMEDLYARASLVVSRAGGMVINEIQSFGLPSILVPFPFATDNHQKANALQVARQGAAINLDQSCLSELSMIVKQLFAEPERLGVIAANATRIARRDAAESIARRVVTRVERPRRELRSSIINVR